MLNIKKFGDIAFRDKDFRTAIDYYSKLVATMQIAFSYCFCQAQFFLLDEWASGACSPGRNAGPGMHARVAYSLLPPIQVLALSKLGLETDVHDIYFSDEPRFEAKKRTKVVASPSRCLLKEKLQW
uniref:Uncharacterized protein n=1 Tax=Arundo donax TaxID=35708 RepID=A0A0A9DGA3_ARUDO